MFREMRINPKAVGKCETEYAMKTLKGKIEVEYRVGRGLKFFIEKEAIFNLRILGPTLLC